MSKLIILRGNSGSGKTALAGVLQQRFGPNTMLISHDMVRMKMLHVWGKEGVEKSLPLMIELVKYSRQHCDITILEGILSAKDYNLLFETAIKEYGTNIFAYYYDISFEETLKRHQTKPNCMDFGEEDLRRWWNEKDYLNIIPEVIFKADVSLEKAANIISADVSA